MAIQSESAATRRQLPSFLTGDNTPTNQIKNDTPTTPSTTPTPTTDPTNPTTPNSSPSPSPSLSSSPSPEPTTPAAAATPTPAASKPTTDSPSPSPSPAPNTPAVASPNNNTPTPAATPATTDHNSTPSPTTTSTPTHNPTTPEVNVITSTLSPNAAHPVVTSYRNLPTGTTAPPPQSSGGLSGGAITGIAIVAGIIGFILLFWVGVQLLQSKKRRREEAEMQEIDFYPNSGGSVVNGGMTYPRGDHSLDRRPSASTSLNFNQKPTPSHYAEPNQYVDGLREEGEFIDPNVAQEYDSSLQRQATLGSNSAYSAGYYNNPAPIPTAPYATNYAPYPNQYPMQPPQPIYDQHVYDYNHTLPPTVEYANAQTTDYLQSAGDYGHTLPPKAEYAHGHPPKSDYGHVLPSNNPPTSIEYQR